MCRVTVNIDVAWMKFTKTKKKDNKRYNGTYEKENIIRNRNLEKRY